MAPKSKYLDKLAGKHVLLIGGTSGLGFCVAEGSIEQGASVVIAGLHPEKLEKALKSLHESYPDSKSKITGYTCDLSKSADRETNLRSLLDNATNHDSKKLNHVVFTAGDHFGEKPLDEITEECIAQAAGVRFTGLVILTKLLAAAYIEHKLENSITFTGGVFSQKPAKAFAVGAAIGSAIEGFTRGAAVEMAPLRINTVSLGGVDTDMFDHFIGGNDKKSHDENRKGFESLMLTGKVGKPEAVAESYLYLMKDDNNTGNILDSNGGYFLK